jgi:hypothetical protein
VTARALSDGELIAGAAALGAVPFADLAVTGAMDLPSRRRMLDAPELVVTRPGGDAVEDTDVAAQANAELREHLGGWFTDDLTDCTRLYDSLAGESVRALAHSDAAVIQLEVPRSAYYFTAFARNGWLVQAAGEPADFHCVSLSLALAAEDALGAGGHPASRPAGPPERLLAEAAPAVDLGSLHDETAEHEPSLYDLYRTGQGIAVKAGVRLRVGPGGSEPTGVPPYLYVVRVNVDLVR